MEHRVRWSPEERNLVFNKALELYKEAVSGGWYGISFVEVLRKAQEATLPSNRWMGGSKGKVGSSSIKILREFIKEKLNSEKEEKSETVQVPVVPAVRGRLSWTGAERASLLSEGTRIYKVCPMPVKPLLEAAQKVLPESRRAVKLSNSQLNWFRDTLETRSVAKFQRYKGSKSEGRSDGVMFENSQDKTETVQAITKVTPSEIYTPVIEETEFSTDLLAQNIAKSLSAELTKIFTKVITDALRDIAGKVVEVTVKEQLPLDSEATLIKESLLIKDGGKPHIVVLGMRPTDVSTLPEYAHLRVQYVKELNEVQRVLTRESTLIHMTRFSNHLNAAIKNRAARIISIPGGKTQLRHQLNVMDHSIQVIPNNI